MTTTATTTEAPVIDEARVGYIAGLRQLADLLESREDLPLPDDRGVSWYLFGFSGLSLDEQKAEAVRIVRLLPGTQRKMETGDLFRFKGSISGLFTQVVVDRPAVCERVVTSVETVTEQVPDPDAPTVEVTREVERVRWDCKPLLAEAVSA